MDFRSPALLEALRPLAPDAYDALPFGVVRMRTGGEVVAYNRFEADLSGLSKARVLGRDFFTAVAPCTNNFLVADRFRDAGDLDDTIPYSFSVNMRPTAVTLRMLRAEGDGDWFLCVETA